MLPNPNTITEQLDAIERMTKTGLIFVTPSGVDLLYSLEENPEAFSKEQLQKTSHILGLINADIIGRIARLSAAVEDANALQAWRDLREQGRKKKEEERLRKDQEIALLRQKEHLCALRAREHEGQAFPVRQPTKRYIDENGGLVLRYANSAKHIENSEQSRLKKITGAAITGVSHESTQVAKLRKMVQMRKEEIDIVNAYPDLPNADLEDAGKMETLLRNKDDARVRKGIRRKYWTRGGKQMLHRELQEYEANLEACLQAPQVPITRPITRSISPSKSD